MQIRVLFAAEYCKYRDNWNVGTKFTNTFKSTRTSNNERFFRFSENLACFVFLLPPFWDSPFCLAIDKLSQSFSTWNFLTLKVGTYKYLYQNLQDKFKHQLIAVIEAHHGFDSKYIHQYFWNSAKVRIKTSRLSAVKYFLKKFFLRCLTGFWLRLFWYVTAGFINPLVPTLSWIISTRRKIRSNILFMSLCNA